MGATGWIDTLCQFISTHQSPDTRVERNIQTGQNNGTLVQTCHDFHQLSRCRYRTGRTGNDHRAGGGNLAQPFGFGVENGISMRRRIRAIEFSQPRRPEYCCDFQEFQRELPPMGIIVCDQLLQCRPGPFFGFHGFQQVGQAAGQPDGIRRICRRYQPVVSVKVRYVCGQVLLPHHDELRQFKQSAGSADWRQKVKQRRLIFFKEA